MALILTVHSETQGEKPYKHGKGHSRSPSVSSGARSPNPEPLLEVAPQPQPERTGSTPSHSSIPQHSEAPDSSLSATAFGSATSNFPTTNASNAGGNDPAGQQNPDGPVASQSPTDNTFGTSPNLGNNASTLQSIPLPGPSDSSTFLDMGQNNFSQMYQDPTNAPFVPFNGMQSVPNRQISDLAYPPPLAYHHEHSPSYSSDSTYSTPSTSNGNPRGPRARSSSIGTAPEWNGSVLAWSPRVGNAPFQTPTFDAIPEDYESGYVSPHLSPPVGSSQSLAVSSVGGFSMELVGTPPLSVVCKPLAQSFPATASSLSNSRLASFIRGRTELVGAQSLDDIHGGLAIDSLVELLDEHLTGYWHLFDPVFPMVNRRLFDRKSSPVLTLAMAAIGTQYSTRAEDRLLGSDLHTTCQRLIKEVSTISTVYRMMSGVFTLQIRCLHANSFRAGTLAPCKLFYLQRSLNDSALQR